MKHSLPADKSLRADDARDVVAAALVPYAEFVRCVDVRVEYDASRIWLVATLHNGRVLYVSERGTSAQSLDLCIDTVTELVHRDARQAEVAADRPSRIIVKNHASNHERSFDDPSLDHTG